MTTSSGSATVPARQSEAEGIEAGVLTGLEQEQHVAGQLRGVAAEQRRGPELNDRMAVVPAGVGYPGHRRAECEVVFLLNRQRVDIRPQGHRRHPDAGVQQADHTGSSHPRAHLQAEVFQPLGNERGGALLLAPELRISVKVAPERSEFGKQVPSF